MSIGNGKLAIELQRGIKLFTVVPEYDMLGHTENQACFRKKVG
ncbi:MAG: hypothetical protein WB992_04980 [Bryobacteraceae bacterium]